MRTVAVSEPAWTEQDRAEILALAAYRDSLCPCGCGLESADTLSHEETGPQFRATRVACRARMKLLDEQQAAPESPYQSARLWRVEKKQR